MAVEVPVVWYEGVNGLEKRSRYGIATLLNEAFDGARDFNFRHQDTMSGVTAGVIVLHGEHLKFRVDEIKAALNKLQWALVVVIGDEGSVFPSYRLQAPNRTIWQQMPVPGIHDFAKRRLICGYPHDTQMHLANYDVLREDRPLTWFFSGQVNHVRRRECVAALGRMYDSRTADGLLIETPGFWQGLEHAEYFKRMAESKFVICPAGCSTPDTMRVAEALEAGCVPIVDGLHYRPGYPKGYWQYCLGDYIPFPIIEDWATLPGLVDALLPHWKVMQTQCMEWWKGYKRGMVGWLEEDLNELYGRWFAQCGPNTH